MGIPRAPKDAGREGRRLWSAVLGEFELNAAELAVLRQAVRAVDRAEALAARLADDGLTAVTAAGSAKLNPVAAELRLTEITIARLLVAMRIPVGGVTEDGEDESAAGRSQYRGPRGVYQIGGAA